MAAITLYVVTPAALRVYVYCCVCVCVYICELWAVTSVTHTKNHAGTRTVCCTHLLMLMSKKGLCTICIVI